MSAILYVSTVCCLEKKLDGNFEGKMFLSEGNMCIITQTACIVLGLFRE